MSERTSDEQNVLTEAGYFGDLNDSLDLSLAHKMLKQIQDCRKTLTEYRTDLLEGYDATIGIIEWELNELLTGKPENWTNNKIRAASQFVENTHTLSVVIEKAVKAKVHFGVMHLLISAAKWSGISQERWIRAKSDKKSHTIIASTQVKKRRQQKAASKARSAKTAKADGNREFYQNYGRQLIHERIKQHPYGDIAASKIRKMIVNRLHNTTGADGSRIEISDGTLINYGIDKPFVNKCLREYSESRSAGESTR